MLVFKMRWLWLAAVAWPLPALLGERGQMKVTRLTPPNIVGSMDTSAPARELKSALPAVFCAASSPAYPLPLECADPYQYGPTGAGKNEK